MQKRSFLGISATLLFAAGAVFAQAPAAVPAFEVASIKPAEPIDPAKIMAGKQRIGMSIDKAQVSIGSLSLSDMIQAAFRVKPYQVSGPDWMTAQRFDVMAKIPEGATSEQVPEMLQALLADRFKLTVHRDSTEHPVYALVVGKNGPKLKESLPDPEPAATAAGAAPPERGGRGGMVFGSGENQVRVNQSGDGKGATVSGAKFGQMKMSMGEGGAMRMEFSKMTMAGLADMLSRFADRPVVDMTELKGNYQVALDLSMDEMRNIARASGMAAGMMMPGPAGGGDGSRTPGDAASTPAATSVFTAVQQMGLKLDPRKAPVERIVIDHLEKTPTEN